MAGDLTQLIGLLLLLKLWLLCRAGERDYLNSALSCTILALYKVFKLLGCRRSIHFWRISLRTKEMEMKCRQGVGDPLVA